MSVTPPEPSGPTLSAGRYVFERKLGEGGHAAVYRVLDRRLNVRRAVKIMLPEPARRPKLRARFEQEARTMAAIDHPHVVRVYDVVTDGPLPFLVMELLTGGSLARWIEVHGPMPARLAISCVRQAGLGLVAAHALGVVHRDVKPHNVLVSADGICKLTDFGIARVAELLHTRAGAVMGTHGYMAPEQARDSSTVDVRVDVFSLGMTLFVLATGRDPVERLAGRGLDALPTPLRPIVERATAFDRSRRPADVQAFLAELDGALPALPSDRPAPPLPLPAADGEALDLEELSTLADERRTSDTGPTIAATAPTPKVLPYSVPERVADQRTPDWVEREAAPVTGFDVEVGDATPAGGRRATASGAAPREADPEAGAEEPETVGGGDATEEVRNIALQLLDIALKNLLDPWRILPTLLLVLPFVIGVPYLKTRELREAAELAREARTTLEARALDPAVLAAGIDLGGDPDTLRTLHADWVATQEEPARTKALKRLIEAMENDLRQFGIAGMPATDRARASLVELRRALADYEAKRTAYEAQRDATAGCLAIGVTPP